MRLAVLELVRRPGRFAVAGGALTLLVILLLFLGGLLDGLFLNSTGALRASDGDAIVYSTDSRESLLRSRIDPDLRQAVEAVEGVSQVGGLGVALLGVQIPGRSDVADGAVAGYELASGVLPAPPPPGAAWADRRLRAQGAAVGDIVLVGPAEVPLEIVGWVSDTNYLLQGGLWVEPGTWRAVQNANRPDAVVADGVFQALVVVAADGVDGAALRASIDEATAGLTRSLSERDAVLALPGVTEQDRVFTAIIGVTFFIAGLVIALFFALVVLERAGIFAVLKAIGTPAGTLVLGVVVQAVVVALGAFVLGWAVTQGLSLAIPAEVPVQFEASRALSVLVGVVVTAVVGGLVPLRRIVRIDPASAIGAGV